ncbi:MAG: hypothetical protein Q4B96_04160 [Bacillota bacterium]|nr:hypothetical protein [Bacillota bacterium]
MDWKLNWKRVVVVAGAGISFSIGSGFATGQETLQYWVPYGVMGLVAAAIFAIINAYVNMEFIDAGKTTGSDNACDVFRYFCGKYIGTFFDWFAVLFCFMSFVVMIAGAGATLNQHFAIPVLAGALVIAILTGITVAFGLTRILNVLGFIGPVIIVLALAASVIGIFAGDTGIANGIQLATSGQYDLLSAGDTWWQACYSYLGFGMMWFAAFFAAIGKKEKNTMDAKVGNAFYNFFLGLAIIMVALAIFSNLEVVVDGGQQIPLLALLNHANPTLATIYSIVIFLGIYSTATPLLWTPVQRLGKEGTSRYIIVTIALTVLGCIIGILVPFSTLMNYIYVINGYVGGILILFIIAKRIKLQIDKKKAVPAE